MVKITSTTTAMLTSMKTTVEEELGACGMEEEDVELNWGVVLPDGRLVVSDLVGGNL